MAQAKKKQGLPEPVLAKMAEAAAQRAWANPETPAGPADEEPAAVAFDVNADPAAVEYCAEFDHSDTDNGTRMKVHFGDDILVIAQERAKTPLFAIWTSTHWDVANGGPKALAIAQRLGDRISMEVEYIKPTPREQMFIDRAAEALKKPEEDRNPAEKRLVIAAEKANEDHGKRIKRRMDHAVTSKNIA